MADQHECLDIETTIEEFLQDCLANGQAPRSVYCYRIELNPFKKFLEQRGIASLTELSRNVLLAYHHYLMATYRGKHGKPIAACTRLHMLSTVKAYLAFCTCHDKLLFNPAEHLPRIKIHKGLPKGILSKQQMKKLLKLPDTKKLSGFRDRLILELFYATGVRRKELNGVTVAD
ncbi:MAG: site-specific integrase, partial [Chloroflexota bacterium]